MNSTTEHPTNAVNAASFYPSTERYPNGVLPNIAPIGIGEEVVGIQQAINEVRNEIVSITNHLDAVLQPEQDSNGLTGEMVKDEPHSVLYLELRNLKHQIYDCATTIRGLNSRLEI